MAKVMIVGSGAREHQIAQMYKKSGHEVYVTPGNEGMTLDNIEIYPGTSLKNASSFLKAAEAIKPDLVDVAQDDALAAGTVDLLTKNNLKTFGPTKEASRIEWGKIWSREKQIEYGLPTPIFESFTRGNKLAEDYATSLLSHCETVFFKADGLYAGKGVIPAKDKKGIEFALSELDKMGSASETFLVEEGLVGEEFSFYAMCDGKNFLCFKSAQDNKRVWNGDLGPNTGGMGSNSPALVTRGIEDKIISTIIDPLVKGLIKDGIEYKGIIYLGGMKRNTGYVQVIEFNSRWGDPEAQVVLPGIRNDYFDLVNSAIDGKLKDMVLRQDEFTRVCVVGASQGYPGDYAKGKEIFVNKKELPKEAELLYAGVNVKNGRMFTNGGRVLNVVGKGTNIIDAKENALKGMACITFEDNYLHYRTDIGARDIQRFHQQQK